MRRKNIVAERRCCCVGYIHSYSTNLGVVVGIGSAIVESKMRAVPRTTSSVVPLPVVEPKERGQRLFIIVDLRVSTTKKR
jgi:hypothetical protein